MSDYYVSENDPATAKIAAERFGFCLVKRVFSAPEMTALENDLAAFQAQFGGTGPDLSLSPTLRRLLVDPRIQALARALLGDTLVYYRETSAKYEEKPGPLTENPFTEYHCDARGTRADLAVPPLEKFNKVYPAYRFGIYFRDYRNHSGGLKVAPGSHLRPFLQDRAFNVEANILKLPDAAHTIGAASMTFPEAPMELYNVPSEPGDLVIFNLRTFHSAGALRFKDRPTLAVLPLLEQQLRAVAPELAAPLPPGARNTIFLDFGAPSEEVDFYVKWRALANTPALIDGLDYASAPPGTVLRNDGVIVAWADRLNALLAKNADGGAPEARAAAAELARHCVSHVEYSAYHPLFDRDAFQKALALDPFMAACGAARQIDARRKVMGSTVS